MTIQKRWETILQVIASAGARGPITIVGVTKYQSLARVEEAVAAGLKVLAVNYAQPGERLREKLKNASLEWHFIGHIQSRKAKKLVDYQCVQSLDRIAIAADMNRRLLEINRSLDVLVEINVGKEAQKSGIAPEEVPQFLLEMKSFSQLRLRGFMGMPPPLFPVEKRLPFFRELRGLFETFQPLHSLDTLSMGTSEDYLIAVQEGSTMVRLGTCLFGEREIDEAFL